MRKRFFLSVVLYSFFLINVYTQNAEDLSDSNKAVSSAYKIESVEYTIDGLTKAGPLSAKLPIDTTRIFSSKKEFDSYIKDLDVKLKNIRTIEKHEINFDFSEPENNLILVTLNIYVKDTWNIIALPYPSFDSNTGLELKLKLKDFNFLGSLEPLTLDLIYNKDNANKSYFSLGSNFALPFYVNPVSFLWHNDLGMSIDQDKNFGFKFRTGLDVSYKFGLDWLTLNAGTSQGIEVAASPAKKDYYFSNGLYTSLIFDIYKHPIIGTIRWSPYFGINGDWKFQKITDDKHKGLNIIWSHSFSMGNVNWINNFRQGFNINLNNSYTYNTYRKGNVDIFFELKSTGFYSFIDKVGLYGKLDFHYSLFGKKSTRSGEMLRGILNNRISTDTTLSFNFDIPVKIGVFKWEEITGVAWTRFFGFEMHIAPFLDIALVHDLESGTYYNPKYGWYSGGFEIIMYPIKMRSLYARISYGHDLREINNKTGFAKRDGMPVSEIFIGIGLHY